MDSKTLIKVRVGGKGDHQKFKHADKKRQVTVPHPNKDIQIGTLRNIYQPSWLGVEKMKYPVYIHRGDADHAHGVTVPDFPGCFSAADDWKNLNAAIQEAIELHCDGEGLILPTPSAIDDLKKDENYTDGEWHLVDINTSKLDCLTYSQSLLKSIRAKAGLSQPAFAQRINTPVATIRDWERARFPVPGATLCLLKLIDKYPALLEELDTNSVK